MKDTRIEFRSSHQEKDLVTLAAQLTGVNISVFLRTAVLQAANEVVLASESINLTNKDRDIFLKALDQPPTPPARLKKAMKKYRQWK